MKFKYLDREPLHIERCWKFDDENGRSPCLAGHLHMKKVGPVFIDINKAPSIPYPDLSFAVWQETHWLWAQLQSEWGNSEFNSKLFFEWLNENAIRMDAPWDCWRAYSETNIGYYTIQIDVGDPDEPADVAVSIFGYDKAYITENAMASRLTKACHDAQSMPGFLGDISFAKAVCEDLYSQLADAPAIQERLRSTIARLAKMCEV